MLANFLRNSANFHWVLSYDSVPEILELYSGFPSLRVYTELYGAGLKKRNRITHPFRRNIISPNSRQSKKASRKREIELLRYLKLFILYHCIGTSIVILMVEEK
jgi:hypothetical protein